MQARFDGSNRASEHLCDLRQRSVLEEAKQNHAAMPLGEAIHTFAQFGGEVGSSGVLGGRELGRNEVFLARVQLVAPERGQPSQRQRTSCECR